MPDPFLRLLRAALRRSVRDARLSLERRIRNRLLRRTRHERGFADTLDKDRLITDLIDDMTSSELLELASDVLQDLLHHIHH